MSKKQHKKVAVIWSTRISQFISQMLIKNTPRQALGNLTKGLKTMENISQTRIKPSVRAVENTIRILFVCHGNICRSPMAEFILKDMVSKRNMEEQFYIESAATSTEEIWNGIGNPVYPLAREELAKHGIRCDEKRAVQLKKSDYEKYDYILGMEERNIRNMMRILGSDPENKVKLFLSYSSRPRDIADPWYTGDFRVTYRDIVEGCEGFLQYLKESGVLSH